MITRRFFVGGGLFAAAAQFFGRASLAAASSPSRQDALLAALNASFTAQYDARVYWANSADPRVRDLTLDSVAGAMEAGTWDAIGLESSVDQFYRDEVAAFIAAFDAEVLGQPAPTEIERGMRTRGGLHLAGYDWEAAAVSEALAHLTVQTRELFGPAGLGPRGSGRRHALRFRTRRAGTVTIDSESGNADYQLFYAAVVNAFGYNTPEATQLVADIRERVSAGLVDGRVPLVLGNSTTDVELTVLARLLAILGVDPWIMQLQRPDGAYSADGQPSNSSATGWSVRYGTGIPSLKKALVFLGTNQDDSGFLGVSGVDSLLESNPVSARELSRVA